MLPAVTKKNERGEAVNERRISRNLQSQKKRQLSNSGKRAKRDVLAIFPTTIDLWLVSLTTSKELSILLLKLLE